jgi:alkyl sulfatase BDS1-like metallo-beta-lactamase superfamily hydrolase
VTVAKFSSQRHGIHRERPGADAIAAATGAPAIEVGDRIWMSPGLSNSYLIGTDDGPIVVNTGMGFEGPLHRRAYETVEAGRTRVVVFTQGHFDHVGGVDSLRDADTEVIAQANFTTWRDDNERLERFRSRNAAFAWIDAILAAMEHAKAVGAGEASQARPEPTTTFVDELEVALGRRELVLLSVPGGETTDALVIWIPASRTLLSGNLFGPLFGHVPNLVTMRGDRYRDALTYVASLDRVLELRPERLLTGHFDPIDGADRIAEAITAMRDSTQWVHDRTVEGMNAGTDVHTLMRQIRLPEELDVGEGYGKVAWNVRAIWETYAGWFHHRSTTELYDTPPASVAPDVVALAGADALVDAARSRLHDGEPVAALHLTDLVLAAEPEHAPSRAVAADAHRALLDASGNFWERAWLNRAIDRLER